MTEGTTVQETARNEAEQLTAADVLERDRYYSIGEVGDALGVPSGTVEAAIAAGRFLNATHQRWSRYNLQSEAQELAGEGVIAWVNECSVATNIKPPIAGEGPGSADPGATLLAEAFAENEAITQQERLGHADATSQAEQSYLALVIRVQSGAGLDSDRSNLVLAMQDLGLSQAQVEADLELVATAAKWQAAYADRDGANQRVQSARSAHEAVLKRHKVEEQLAFQRKTAAECYAGECHEARQRLYELSSARPSLFTTDADPPRLSVDLPVPVEPGVGTG